MWCGTIGAWLLVGGPLYQGALELTDSADDAHFDDAIPQGREVAWWWWMVSPAAVLLLWIEERRFRRLWPASWRAHGHYWRKFRRWWPSAASICPGA
mgnify:CR=1 FL=1